jgi:F-type H+-transporting ATPase subunit gamma
MANIKDLKKKIKTTKSTLKITSAMKLVSAAKLNKAQHAILSARPYARELEETISVASTLVENYTHPFLRQSETVNRIAVLAISADKGLCASYNSSVVKKCRLIQKECGDKARFYFIGKKAFDILKREVNLAKKFTFKRSDLTFAEINQVCNELSELFKAGEFDEVRVVFNEFHSAISFTTQNRRVLPFVLEKEKAEKIAKQYPFDFKYEPSPLEILDTLIPQTLINLVYTSYLDAAAAEHGSRMSAMDSATGNCKEAIRSLTLNMNKLRQAAITTELIEVVSGAESLNN